MEEIVEKEGNAKGEGFMSSLAFINVKAKVNGEAKSYDWVVKSTPAALAFPFFVVAMIPYRMLLKFVFNERELAAVSIVVLL